MVDSTKASLTTQFTWIHLMISLLFLTLERQHKATLSHFLPPLNVLFFVSPPQGSLKNMIKEGNRRTIKETVLKSALKPLDKEDLKLIYTLGPKVSKAPTMKHVCV